MAVGIFFIPFVIRIVINAKTNEDLEHVLHVFTLTILFIKVILAAPLPLLPITVEQGESKSGILLSPSIKATLFR